jgi:molecular chaperone Hsp33
MSDTHPDALYRFIGEDDFRIVVCLNTGAVREGVVRHGLSGASAIALGRALTAAQLLGTGDKGSAVRITVQINGDGPMRGVVADARVDGTVRGYVTAPAPVAVDGDRRPRVRPVLGKVGTVTVTRDDGRGQPYRGTNRITMGEIDEDIETWTRESLQIPTAICCEVQPGPGGVPAASVGVLVQGMPGTRAREGDPVREAQHRMRTTELWKALVSGERDPATLARAVVPDFAFRPVGQPTPVRFACPCDRERVSGALLALGKDELEEMVVSPGFAEVTCHFCNTRYEIAGEDLAALAARAGDPQRLD